MKLQSPKLVSADDIQGAPSWATKIVDAYNLALEQTAQILQAAASLKHNLNAEILELKLQDDVETTIRLNTLRGLPRHVRVSWSDHAGYPEMYWRPATGDSRKIIVSVRWDPTPSAAVLTRIVVEGD